jgi:HSP20 family protein
MAMERMRPSWGLRHRGSAGEIDEMERRMEEMWRSFWPATWRRPMEEWGWAPPIEMFEKEDRFIVKAELPGMEKDQIDISMVGDTLTIKGERKAEKEVKQEDYYLSERSYGGFVRAISMPSAVDARDVKASYQDGILEITVPKAAEVKPKKIPIGLK